MQNSIMRCYIYYSDDGSDDGLIVVDLENVLGDGRDRVLEVELEQHLVGGEEERERRQKVRQRKRRKRTMVALHHPASASTLLCICNSTAIASCSSSSYFTSPPEPMQMQSDVNVYARQYRVTIVLIIF